MTNPLQHQGACPRGAKLACATLVAALTGSHAAATWSICCADTETGEVAVGTVTCLNQFDLLTEVPVVVVGKGAAASQSLLDADGSRRMVMFEGLVAGRSPEDIFADLEQLTGHQQRQYGLADTQGRGFSFSGSLNGAWAGGRTFQIGTTFYAIQGNVLAGACVIDAIEVAILDGHANGLDTPDILMAAMEAARGTGGDGRCSCLTGDPPDCGCPIEEFEKSGHIGGMVVARAGDTDDLFCDADGCVDGDYFMHLNVAFQANEDPDPVFQLQAQFDAWRAALVGRPDAIRSTVTLDPPRLPPDGVSTATMTITLRDYRNLPVEAAIDSVAVEHGVESAALSTIGEVVEVGQGVYEATITAGNRCGTDLLDVFVDDGIRPVTLMPKTRLEYFADADVDMTGVVDFEDVLAVLAAWGPYDPCPPYEAEDVDRSCDVGFNDLIAVLAAWGPCEAPVGMCCLRDGTCTAWPEDICVRRGGLYHQDESCEGGCPVPADQCSDAPTVSEGAYFYTNEESTTDGARLPDECDEGNGVRPRRDVWVEYVASCDGVAVASVCDSTFDSWLVVYDADCQGDLVACSDDACGEGGTRSEVSFPVTAGGHYPIRLAGSNNEIGEGVLTIDCTAEGP